MSVKIAIPEMGLDDWRVPLKAKYVEALEAQGAEAVWIDLTDLVKAANDADLCDGLLIPGGPGVDPRYWGDDTYVSPHDLNYPRQFGETLMMKIFTGKKKPVLGICHGCQMINGFFGGSLYFNVVEELGAHNHMTGDTPFQVSHDVTVIHNTKLHDIFGATVVSVNSMHNQAAKDVAPGLTVSAVSDDGIVEGLEHKGYPFVVGVQWHPEWMQENRPDMANLFKAFVDACR